MSWRVPTRDDLIATLSQKEADAFASSAEFTEEPVNILIRRSAEFVRSFIRRNGSVVMSPEDASLPEGCISPCMDYAASDILKRLAVPMNEDRRKARQDAFTFFVSIANNKVTPESYSADDTDTTATVAGTPTSADASPERLLD